MTYALDSNIVSYFLKKDNEIRKKLAAEIKAGNKVTLPVIVYFGVKRWLLEIGATNKHAEFELLCRSVRPEEFDMDVWDSAAKLYVKMRRQGQPIDDADLLIAVFCNVNRYTLATNNIRHLKRIEGLRFINWKV